VVTLPYGQNEHPYVMRLQDLSPLGADAPSSPSYHPFFGSVGGQVRGRLSQREAGSEAGWVRGRLDQREVR
jgi:hypothetical protein